MLWQYVCEFHRKFPLAYSMYCCCSITEVDKKPDFSFHGAVGYFDVIEQETETIKSELNT